MTGHDLRAKYLQFFEQKNSLIIPSASLIPTDPTTLLTSAGMQPLVPFFKGEETPPATRLASCQKCCRADDIEQVGVTWRHASFFEMLGNFSFGDYFKREAIVWGWEFLTKELNIDPDVLWVSVYFEDKEAPEIWKKDVGLSDERIYRFDKKDNWWGPVGKSGPCGPDSEIFFDRGAKYDTGDAEMDRPGGDGDRYGEIWNLVFQQYNQTESGELLALPAPGIDTGMGLERTAAILQGVDTIHHTDLFAPLINAISAAKREGDLRFDLSTPQLHREDPTTKPLRVIADHVRAAIFLAADGVTPGNNGRDYMLRRFIRRAYLNGRALGLDKPFLHRIVPVVEQSYGAVYPELIERRALISDLILREEERFGVTIESGMNRLEDLIDDAKKKGLKSLSGAEVFSLYSSQGFPPELTADILADNDLSYDANEFEAASQSHSKISGSAVGEYQKRKFDVDQDIKFVGYKELIHAASVYLFSPHMVDGSETANHFDVVLTTTPFYAESGGQVGDTGELWSEDADFSAKVLDTQKEGKTWIHTVEVIRGEIKEGLKVTARVDMTRRRAIERAHSSTHLLHAALRQHLGKHVEQRGSLVEGDRLRFDFVHFAPVSVEELETIEKTVNEEILASLPIKIAEKTLAEARAMGAMALFGEKYGDVVRTVKMGDFSLELCGGTHLPNTSAAGLLRIVSEGGVGANLRRIEALTGAAALEYDRAQSQKLREVAAEIGAKPENALAAAQKLGSRVRELEKQLAQMQRKLSGGAEEEILASASEVKGIKFVASRAPEGLSGDALRDLADKLAQKLDGVVVLASESGGKVMWAVKASKGAVEKGAHAGNIVKSLAQITGGGGGGRPDFAQAGGKDVSKIDEALGQAAQLV